MKKSLLILLAIFLTMGVFTSCEEEEEPAQTLTAFVIGEWESQEVIVDITPVYFLVDIEADHYTLSMTDGEQTVPAYPADYTIDDENTISIEQPTWQGDEPTGEWISFTVTWEEGGNTMKWLPVDPLENDAPTLIWTRQTGI